MNLVSTVIASDQGPRSYLERDGGGGGGGGGGEGGMVGWPVTQSVRAD